MRKIYGVNLLFGFYSSTKAHCLAIKKQIDSNRFSPTFLPFGGFLK